ncbi:lyase family protein [Rhodovibrio sodomensis]|uniref:lyase family protein n=1 Tax=Rhodovibrio sodomensis TaxID=1088 RepID=UPI0019082A64
MSAFDSALTGDLLADADVRALFSDSRRIADMLRVESGLACAQARLGVIPPGVACRIVDAGTALQPDLAAIGAATARDGVPVPELVRQLRAALDAEAAAYVHYGATSQDIVDTAGVLALRDLCDLVDRRARDLVQRLAALAARHRATLCLARTRTQPAVPTSFGLRALAWARPLSRERARLAALRGEVLCVQFGGAAGNLSALGDRGPAVADALAGELGLAPSVPAWHGERDGLLALTDALARIAGALGKLGQDVAHGCQAEVAELRLSSGGGSSTMPNKANPVAAETLVALARHAAGSLAAAHQAQLHALERDGAAWTLEWLNLPQVAMAAGGGLARARAVLDALTVDTHRMAAAVTGGAGLPMAEAASFALAEHVPRVDAQATVAAACRTASDAGEHLLDVLARQSDAAVDWADLRRAERLLGPAPDLVDRALSQLASDERQGETGKPRTK